jgi:FkbM family methyltransferase
LQFWACAFVVSTAPLFEVDETKREGGGGGHVVSTVHVFINLIIKLLNCCVSFFFHLFQFVLAEGWDFPVVDWNNHCTMQLSGRNVVIGIASLLLLFVVGNHIATNGLDSATLGISGNSDAVTELRARVDVLEALVGGQPVAVESFERVARVEFEGTRGDGGELGGGDISKPTLSIPSIAAEGSPAAGPLTSFRDARKVFIDLGANCGNSFKRLRNQKRLEGSDWEAWLWEANPQMVHFYLNDLALQDKRVRVVPLAAWTENKKMQFFLTKGQEDVTDITKFKAHQCKAGSHYQPSGASSLFSGKGDGGADDARRRTSKYKPGKAIEVDAVDFNSWLADQDLTQQDEVILKIDIEGAEIPLLKHMVDAGDEICTIDHFLIEWHSWMLADPKSQGETEAYEKDFINKTFTEKCGFTPTFGEWH